MLNPSAIMRQAVALACLFSAMAFMTPGPASARAGYTPTQCTRAHTPQYNLAAIDQQLGRIGPFIAACGNGNWNACLQGREILAWADMVVEQILNWNAENYCRNCLLDNLLVRANNLAGAAQALRAASGNQLNINADRTAGIVASHLNDPGCCPSGTVWNQNIGNCQAGTTPLPGTRKDCNVTSSYQHNMGGALCNVWRKRTNQGLVYEIIINPMNPYNPPFGFQLFYSNAPCAQATANEDARCRNWKTP